MNCRFCGRKLNTGERERGRCSDRVACADRVQKKLDKQLQKMVKKPMFSARQEQAAYEAAPKLGDSPSRV